MAPCASPDHTLEMTPLSRVMTKPRPFPQLLLLDNLGGLLLSYSGAVLFFTLPRKEASQRLSATGKQGD